MVNETQPAKPVILDDEIKPEIVGAKSVFHRLTYKTVVVAIVIVLCTVSSLWVFVILRSDNPANVTEATTPDIQVHENTVTKNPEIEPLEDQYGIIDRKLVSLSGRIDREFESQQTHNSEVKRNLKVITESLENNREAIVALDESSQAQGRHTSKITSRLDVLVKDVRALKNAQSKSQARNKSLPGKHPPFHIDAIDIWDDLSYVAISQAGKIAFLKPGDQQSGWTVIRVDHLKGQVDFEGPAGQIHIVSVRR